MWLLIRRLLRLVGRLLLRLNGVGIDGLGLDRRLLLLTVRQLRLLWLTVGLLRLQG